LNPKRKEKQSQVKKKQSQVKKKQSQVKKKQSQERIKSRKQQEKKKKKKELSKISLIWCDPMLGFIRIIQKGKVLKRRIIESGLLKSVWCLGCGRCRRMRMRRKDGRFSLTTREEKEKKERVAGKTRRMTSKPMTPVHTGVIVAGALTSLMGRTVPGSSERGGGGEEMGGVEMMGTYKSSE
jgi:hypothetical protein